MTSSEPQAKAIVRDFLATFSTGNVPAIVDALHDTATWWVSGSIEGMSGTYTKAALAPLLAGATSLYKTGALRITPISMIAEGNKVAVEAESFAEFHDGRIYNNFYHFLFETRDGKVSLIREYMDTMHTRAAFFPSA